MDVIVTNWTWEHVTPGHSDKHDCEQGYHIFLANIVCIKENCFFIKKSTHWQKATVEKGKCAFDFTILEQKIDAAIPGPERPVAPGSKYEVLIFLVLKLHSSVKRHKNDHTETKTNQQEKHLENDCNLLKNDQKDT